MNNVLARTARRLQTARQLAIGYLGGSLTEGYGASDPAKTCWRARTTQWFRERFPEAAIREIYAAVGGTGSDLGVYRVGVDLLDQKPDLVFVEFAVNDSAYLFHKEEWVTPAMEGIVRHIWRVNPLADIVLVYTTQRDFAPIHEKGEKPPTVILHQKLADHYGIPSVNIGEAIWAAIQSGAATWEALMPDTCHPLDAGYAIYAEAVRKFLESQDWDAASSEPVALPPRLRANAVEYSKFTDAWEVDAPGWTREEKPISLRPHRIASNRPGTELAFKFRGNAIGILWLSADDSGNVEGTVDGVPFESRASWTPWGGKEGRGYGAFFYDPLFDTPLPPGDHLLVLRVSAQTDPKSTGTWVRIAGFFTNEVPS